MLPLAQQHRHLARPVRQGAFLLRSVVFGPYKPCQGLRDQQPHCQQYLADPLPGAQRRRASLWPAQQQPSGAQAISSLVGAANWKPMNPVTELQTVYQRLKLPLPRYEFVEAACGAPAANARFVCNVFAQVEVGPSNTLEEQVYQGEGTTKKAAKANGATSALEMLRPTPMYARALAAAPAKDVPLWEALEQALSDEGLKKDPCLRPYVLWAQAYSPGAVLPLSALTHVRSVRGWLKLKVPDTADDHHAMTRAMAMRLLAAQQRRGAAAVASSIEVVGDAEAGLGVRRTQHFAQAGVVEGHGLVDDVESAQPAVVLLPADSSLPPQEVRINAGGNVLGKVASVMGCDPTHLIVWGRVGHKVYYVATPAQLAEQQQRGQQRQEVLQDALLLQTEEQRQQQQQQQQGVQPLQVSNGFQRQPSVDEPPAKRRMPEANVDSQASMRERSGPVVMDWDDKDPEVKGPEHTAQAAATAGAHEAHGGHVIKLAEPVLYSVSMGDEKAAAVNLRASWLAGRPVRGDAVLSLCRLSSTQQHGAHVVKWSDYSLADYWRGAAAAFPCAEYARALHSPILHRLPEQYRDPSSWQGTTPCRLLDAYIQRHAWRCRQTWEVQRIDVSDRYVAKVQVVAFGSGAPVEVQAEHASQYIAKNQAALSMLHRLELVDAAGLLRHDPTAILEQQQRAPQGEAQQLEVTEPGEEGRMLPAPGLCAKVDAHLFIPAANTANEPPGAGSTAADYTVEHRPAMGFELGSGAVMPALEAAVMRLRVKGIARCSVQVTLEGADSLGKFEPVPCTLQVRLLSVTAPRFAGEGAVYAGHGRALFDPPLSVQRYDLVTKVVQDTGARTVVDLGCGEGRLISHLLRNCAFTSLQRIVGIDHSDNAMQLASRRLERLVTRLSTMVELPLHQQQQQEGQQEQQGGQQEQQGDQGGQQEQQEQQEQQSQDMAWPSAALVQEARQASVGPATAGSQMAEDEGVAQEAGPSRGDTTSADQPQVAEWGRGGVLRGSGLLDRQASVHQALRRGQSQTLSTSGPPAPLPLFKRPRSPAPSAISIAEPSARLGSNTAAMSDSALDEAAGNPGGAAVWSAQVSLIQADFAAQAMTQPEAWGPLGSCDLATLVEVIEHLDPLPLALTAPALLGGLRPRVAIVTTPNYEYNRVLTAANGLATNAGVAAEAATATGTADAAGATAGAGGAAGGGEAVADAAGAGDAAAGGAGAGPSTSGAASTGVAAAEPGTSMQHADAGAARRDGGNGPTSSTGSGKRVLRNSDHRFEWTREEFRRWAHDAAGAFGYDVAFEDVGHVLTEEDVLGSQGWEGVKDVGAAVQVAVFTRRGDAARHGVRLPAAAWGPRRLAVVVGGEGDGVAAAEGSDAAGQGQEGGLGVDENDVPVEHF